MNAYYSTIKRLRRSASDERRLFHDKKKENWKNSKLAKVACDDTEKSRDYKVRTADVQVRTGRKWSASKAVSEAESRLRHKDIVGTVAVGRQGFGTSKS
ncbi:Hypothetical predicted protein [Mytilus galloprovincialis]|uniref:Uncharacterized protein n=1 Tax=Mytilus galloprovincialis TaxID=29158 RepID=A0A8B6F326_MYTGA|nr:Hypothetical predicted protein [Mytilus galloprovincialis]